MVSDSSIALNNVAWLLVTSVDPTLRDPARALELALRARERSDEPDPDVLDTLAAAHAGLGDFVTARAVAAEAIATARERGELETAEAIAERLDRYRRDESFPD